MSINKKLHPISRDVMSYNYIFIVDTKKSPPMWGLMVAAHGFEPRTHRVWTDCSSQLSYAAMYGASDRDWTGDLSLTKDTLCRLSYTSTMNVHFTVKLWLRGQDLNLRPSGYEPDELPTAPPRYKWWREKDSNLRSRRRQIYSLLPLAARESLQK